MRNSTRPALVLIAALLAPACSGSSSSQTPANASTFTPQLARLFDDSVDYVTSVEGLGGRGAADWQAQVDGLSTSSDVIGVARIETLLLGTDVDGTRVYRLTAAITETIHGEQQTESRVPLAVSEGQNGFNTVAGKEARLQTGQYVLFIRWYTDGTGTRRAHWHLSPLTEALNARVRRASGAEARDQGQERIVSQSGSNPPR